MALQGVLLNKTDILRVAVSNGGIITHMAECLDCVPNTIYDWMERDEEVKEAISHARKMRAKLRVYKREDKEEEILDECYEGLLELVKARHPGCIMFALERKGKWTKEQVQQAVNQLTYLINNAGDQPHDINSTKPILSAAIPDADIAGVESGD